MDVLEVANLIRALAGWTGRGERGANSIKVVQGKTREIKALYRGYGERGREGKGRNIWLQCVYKAQLHIVFTQHIKATVNLIRISVRVATTVA